MPSSSLAGVGVHVPEEFEIRDKEKCGMPVINEIFWAGVFLEMKNYVHMVLLL